MIRKNHAHISLSSLREQWFERARRTQFHVDVFRVGQESPKQIVPFLKRQIIGAAFARTAGGDDDRRGLATASPSFGGQFRHLALKLIGNGVEMIESNFKKIGRFAHGEGKTKI